MSRIFISYRRSESPHIAGRLADRLETAIDHVDVFMDVDAIEPGEDFVNAIKTAVASCDALIVLIGPEWATLTDESGQRRIHNPDDYVALEVSTALTSGVRVIPVLVDSARMPRSDELPNSLKELVRKNAVRVDHETFGTDVEPLISVLRKSFGRTGQAVSHRPSNSTGRESRLDVADLRARAKQLRENGDFESALVVYDLVLSIDPESGRALAGRGVTLRLLHRYREAIDELTKAIGIEPTSAWIYAERAKTYRERDDFDRSLADYNIALSLAPDAAWIIADRATVLRLRGDAEAAIAQYDLALDKEADTAWIIAARAVALRDCGRPEVALEELDRALGLDASSAWILSERGRTQRHLGDYRAALTDYTRAVELAPDTAWIVADRASALRKCGERKSAIAELTRALKMAPNTAWILAERGKTYAELNDLDRALRDYDQAVHLAPDIGWISRDRERVVDRVSRRG